MPIPPRGWGAVEILIDDYRKTLVEMGHQVEIVNTRNPNLIVGLVNALEPDFVHIQYDEFGGIVPHLKCKNVAMTSHYGYLEQPDRWDPGYKNIFWSFINNTARLFCLSQGIADVYEKAGVDKDRLFVIPNGVRNDLFRFDKECKYVDRSLYLAKIDPRKRQSNFQTIESLYFAGNCVDPTFDKNSPRYLGEWTKDKLYEETTNYANLVLLSDGEAHPLVCLEAMSAGLGLVISQFAAANLDTSLPFIDVVTEDKIGDIEYISEVIRKNRSKSIQMREDIKRYAQTFDWRNICEKYLTFVMK
jgi:glycosyltransferase involved in cell wall biosynthesis